MAKHKLIHAAEERTRKTLKSYSLIKLQVLSAAWLGIGLWSFYVPLIGMAAAFFGIVEFARLMRPDLYSFTFKTSTLLYLRIATAAHFLLGCAGTIYNQGNMPYLKPFLDWINS